MRQLRAALGATVLVGVLGVAGLATAPCAFACSCVPPGPIADYRGQEDIVVLAGTVATLDADQRGSFLVERWYQGGAAAVVPIRGGQGADCGLPLTLGQHLILVAYAGEGIVAAGICTPSGDLNTPEGQKLAQEVAAAFGPGAVPAGSGDDDGGEDAGIVGPVALAVVIGGALLLVSVLAFARRERPGPAQD